MNWIALTSEEQLTDLLAKSKERPQVIFKHSTRCSISGMVKNRLDKMPDIDNADFYYLDLLAYRSLSDLIEHKLSVTHESPQVIIVRDGKPIYDADHMGITADEILESL